MVLLGLGAQSFGRVAAGVVGCSLFQMLLLLLLLCLLSRWAVMAQNRSWHARFIAEFVFLLL